MDLRQLNKNVIMPKFQSATLSRATRTMPHGMKYFTVVDALKDCHPGTAG